MVLARLSKFVCDDVDVDGVGDVCDVDVDGVSDEWC